MSLCRSILCLFALALLSGQVGCGGGGGSSAPSEVLSLSASTASFHGSHRDFTPPAPVFITGTISNPKGTVYLFVEYTQQGLDGVNVSISGTTGQLVLFPKAGAYMPAGATHDTVKIYASHDPGRTQPIAGSPQTIQVTYDVMGVSIGSGPVSVAGVEGAAPPAQVLQVANASGSAAWATSVTYASGADWLELTPASGTGTSGTPSLTFKPMPIGNYSASVRLSAGAEEATVQVFYAVSRRLQVPAGDVYFNAIGGQDGLPAAIPVAISSPLPSQAYTTSVSYGPGATGWLSASGATAPGNLSLAPTTTSLQPGASYDATVTLSPVGGGTATAIPVHYAIGAASLNLSTPSPFVVNGATTASPAEMTRTLTTSSTGAALTWTATSSVPWLSVTPSGVSGSSALLTLLPAQLESVPNGTQQASITFTYGGFGVTGATASVEVPLQLSLPTVNFVAPYLAYLDEQKEVILRGSGLREEDLPNVKVGGLAPQAIRRVSDTEIRLTPAPFAGVGRLPITLASANSLGIARSTAEMVVRTKPVHTAFRMDTGTGIPDRHLIYDAERDAVFSYCPWFGTGGSAAGAPSYINRFTFNPGEGTWTRTSQFFLNLWDIALSPDGKNLLVLTTNRLYWVDPITFAANGHVDFNTSGMGTAGQMAVMNDGRVLLRDLGRAFSLVDHTFSSVVFPNGIAIDGCANGSMATVGDANNSSWVPISIYDASTGLVRPSTALQYYSRTSMSWDGSRWFSGNTLRDRDLNLIGGVPTYEGYLSPDGQRVYSFDYNALKVRAFDVSGAGPSFPELVPLDPGVDPSSNWMIVSLDNRTLFIVGGSKFVVIPLP